MPSWGQWSQLRCKATRGQICAFYHAAGHCGITAAAEDMKLSSQTAATEQLHCVYVRNPVCDRSAYSPRRGHYEKSGDWIKHQNVKKGETALCVSKHEP